MLNDNFNASHLIIEYKKNYMNTLYMYLAVTYFGMNTLINLRKEADHFWDIQFIGNDRSI